MMKTEFTENLNKYWSVRAVKSVKSFKNNYTYGVVAKDCMEALQLVMQNYPDAEVINIAHYGPVNLNIVANANMPTIELNEATRELVK